MKRDDEEDGIAGAIFNALLVAIIVGFIFGSYAVFQNGPVRAKPGMRIEREAR